MAIKIIFIVAALVACVHARPGGPAAYSISAPAGDHQSVGNTHEHTVKGPGGASSQSDYTSQVQTAHSQSHVSRSSISNDHGLGPAHGVAVAAAPVYQHYAAAPAYQHYAPAPAYQHYAAAPAYQHYAAAPALAHGYAAYGHTAPAPAPAHGYGYGYGGHEYATAPAYYGHSAEPISHNYVATEAIHAAPAYAAHHIAPLPAYGHLQPIVKAVAAPALVHADVHGHGIHYGY